MTVYIQGIIEDLHTVSKIIKDLEHALNNNEYLSIYSKRLMAVGIDENYRLIGFFRSDEENLYYVAFDLYIDINHMSETYELSYWYKHAYPLNQRVKAIKEFKKEIQHIVWMSDRFGFEYMKTI